MVNIRRPRHVIPCLESTLSSERYQNLIVVVILLFALRTAFLLYGFESSLLADTGNLGPSSKEIVIHDIITVPIVIYDAPKHAANNNNNSNDNHIPSAKSESHLTKVRITPIRQLLLAEMKNPEHQNARTKPLLLTGWNDYQKDDNAKLFSSAMEEDNFRKEYGKYTQFVKNQLAQPLKDKQGRKCIATSCAIVELMKMKSTASEMISSLTNDHYLSFITNDLESPDFFSAFKRKYTIPLPLNFYEAGFQKHDGIISFQINGRKMWWFVPPDTPKNSSNENPCSFLTNNGDMLPEGSLSVLQQQGDTIYVPKGWWYAIDDWNTAVGMRMAGMADQMIDSLPRSLNEKIYPMPWTEGNAFQTKMTECGVEFDWSNPSSWTWFQGDLNEYYNELIRSDSKRNPQEISSYAVHRWLGKDKSTLVHYELIHGTIQHVIIGNDSDHRNNLRVLDAGCGLGAGLMWFETYAAESWTLVGHTISTAQLDFIQNKIPSHQFDAVLKSYDDLDVYKKDGARFDAMYSIEAFVHSPDERNTLKQWSEALAKGGIIVIIDDFLSVGVDKEAEDVQLYAKSWMSNVLLTTSSLADMAETFGLELIIDRDLGSEYQVVKRNYRNKLPDIRPTKEKHHQGWLGSGMRQRLMVQGKLTYRMVVFQKKGQK